MQLLNTSTADSWVPTDVLTGLFFNLSGATLNPLSASLGEGSVIYDLASYSKNVGGEWAFGSKLGIGTKTYSYGVSAAGLGLFGPKDRFDTSSNLAGTENVGGLDFGIVTAGDNQATANGGLDRNLIKGSVVFTFGLSNLSSNFDLAKAIGDVRFQYGTSTSEASFSGSLSNPSSGTKPVEVVSTPAPAPTPVPAPAPTPTPETKPVEVVSTPAPAPAPVPVPAPTPTPETKPVEIVSTPAPAPTPIPETKPVEIVPISAPTPETKPVEILPISTPAPTPEIKPVEVMPISTPAPEPEIKPVEAVVPPAPEPETKPVEAVSPSVPPSSSTSPEPEVKPVEVVTPPPSSPTLPPVAVVSSVPKEPTKPVEVPEPSTVFMALSSIGAFKLLKRKAKQS
jgi:hypothetical protein